MAAVTLGEGLEEIGEYAFYDCMTLQRIVILDAIETIKAEAFQMCMWLTTVTLGNGIEEIGKKAFCSCMSLEHILIPPAIKRIHDTSFKGCLSLKSVKFCDEIEKFVSSKAVRGWWKQGVHPKSSSTYCYLVQCSVPERLMGLALVSSWQANINDMLRSIPTIVATATDDDDNDNDNDDDDDDNNDDDKDLNAYFDTINDKMSLYENLLNEAPVLFPEQFGLNHGIALNILSFL